MKETKYWTRICSKDTLTSRRGKEVSEYAVHLKGDHLLLNSKYIDDNGKVRSVCKRYTEVDESSSYHPVKDVIPST